MGWLGIKRKEGVHTEITEDARRATENYSPLRAKRHLPTPRPSAWPR